MAHPWLAAKGSGGAPDVPLDYEVLSRMKTFAKQTKFKQVATMVLLKHLKEEELAGLQLIFDELDADGSGTITVNEMKAGLERHGAHIPLAEVDALVKRLDLDGNSALSYQEFLAATVQLHKASAESLLLKVFQEIDVDSSGSISAEELAAKMRELGIDTDLDEVSRMIDEADKVNNGTIEFEEFVALMAPHLTEKNVGTLSRTSSVVRLNLSRGVSGVSTESHKGEA